MVLISETSSTLAFQVTFWSSVIATLSCVALCGVLLMRARSRGAAAAAGERLARRLVILPVFEPLLWFLLVAFLVQTVMLGAPGPYPAVPSWFVGSSFTGAGAGAASWAWNNSAFYFAYWFIFELVSDGFGLCLLHRYPSRANFAASLRYAALYGAMSSGLATLGFNWSLLGVRRATQLAIDSAVSGIPCALYIPLLLFPAQLAGHRPSIAVYSAFSVVWRLASVIALNTGGFGSDGSYESALGAAITVLRSMFLPPVMYFVLLLETRYWRNLAGATLDKLDTVAVVSLAIPAADGASKQAIASAATSTASAAVSPAPSAVAPPTAGPAAASAAQLRMSLVAVTPRGEIRKRAATQPSLTLLGVIGPGPGSGSGPFFGEPVAGTTASSGEAVDPQPESSRFKAADGGGARGGDSAPDLSSSLLLRNWSQLGGDSAASALQPPVLLRPLPQDFQVGAGGGISAQLGAGLLAAGVSLWRAMAFGRAAALRAPLADLAEGTTDTALSSPVTRVSPRAEKGRPADTGADADEDGEVDEATMLNVARSNAASGGGLAGNDGGAAKFLSAADYFGEEARAAQRQRGSAQDKARARAAKARGGAGASIDVAAAAADIAKVQRFEHDNARFLVDFTALEIGEYIDRGGTSVVYSGRYRGEAVAIKMFRPERIDEHCIAFFHRENAVSAAFQHPSIVRYYGLCVSPPHISLVFELCARGSLYNVIETIIERNENDEYEEQNGGGGGGSGGVSASSGAGYGSAGPSSSSSALPPLRPRFSLSWARRLRMARDGAAAIAYLHAFEPPYLHRDVKSQNFLVTSDYRLKLSDFGESRARQPSALAAHGGAPMTGEIGTTHWMAPEMFSNEDYSEAVDVYGFGIVLWELASERHPYEDLSEHQIFHAVSVRGLRPKVPQGCPPAFARLMQQCWQGQPRRRPRAQQVVEALDAMLADLAAGPASARPAALAAVAVA